MLRRQSDDSSRIDRDALGRVGGDNVRWRAGLNGSFDASDVGWPKTRQRWSSAKRVELRDVPQQTDLSHRRADEKSLVCLGNPSDRKPGTRSNAMTPRFAATRWLQTSLEESMDMHRASIAMAAVRSDVDPSSHALSVPARPLPHARTKIFTTLLT